MVRLVLVLLGVDYLRRRTAGMYWLGFLFVLAGLVLLVDSLDNDHYFPLSVFAGLLAVGGIGALAIGALSTGGLRIGRMIEGIVFVIAASLVMTGHQHGGFWLSMIFGTLFLIDGLLQCLSATVVRYPRWRGALWGGLCEIAIAISFYSPYPFGYSGAVPYALGLALMFVGWGMLWLAVRVRLLPEGTSVEQLMHGALYKPVAAEPGAAADAPAGPLDGGEPELVVHVWLPAGTVRQVPLQRRPLIDRYVAAVDAKGAVWTGHVAMNAPGGPYISLDPATPMKRSLQGMRMLHAAAYNNVIGHFQSDYETDARLRGPSTERIRIRNFDASRLRRFWHHYRQDTTYNLTRRNCAVSVARALEAGVEGAVSRLHGSDPGWHLFFTLLLMPELWVAAQIRKRAKTMAWTPGLVLDYARALGMLVDPPSIGWFRISMTAWRRVAGRRGGAAVPTDDSA